MTYVKIQNKLYPAAISGQVSDRSWDSRESKALSLDLDYETAKELFVDGITWSIVEQWETPVYEMDEKGRYVLDEHGEPVQVGTEMQQTEWDNSAFNLAGDLIDHRDGTITVKLGKPTDLEAAYEILYGGIT